MNIREERKEEQKPENTEEFHIDVKEEITALEQLHISTAYSKSRIKDIMQKGAVWLTSGKNTGRIRRAGKILKPGMAIHLYYDEKVLAQKPAPPLLISDEGSYSIWYKPYGMYSQGTKWGDHCTVYRWAESNLIPQKPAFIVHRLDRAARGLIIVSHSKTITGRFTEIFEQRKIKKIYRVIVHGNFLQDSENRTISSDIDGKRAISHVTQLEYYEKKDISLLEVLIETGRKHQIRKHLSQVGFPVAGDRLYGKNEESVDLQLCAHYISFACPESGIKKEYCLSDELTLQFPLQD